MEPNTIEFDEQNSLHKLGHYLPAQAPLKDFVHHNTLHAFQHEKFHSALQNASQIFGYKTYLSLEEYRKLYSEGKIREDILNNLIEEKILQGYNVDTKLKIANSNDWKQKLLFHPYQQNLTSRIGHLRSGWKDLYKINLDKVVHPFLFRLLSAYLDQGISIWAFPQSTKGFLDSIRGLEKNGFTSLFKADRPRKILLENSHTLKDLLQLIVGEESLFEHYLFDQQFAHPGWSGMVSTVENSPETLLNQKVISLHDMIFMELLLELDALDQKFGTNWKPLSEQLSEPITPIFKSVEYSEIYEVLSIWQNAFEWSYFDDVIASIKLSKHPENEEKKSFQALFCIDDREYSLRRYIESIDKKSETFGTPGFFGVEFYFQPENGKFYTKACPAPVTPKFLIREQDRSKDHHLVDAHYNRNSHRPLAGWLISQTLGFWSAFKLFINIFKPSISPATAYSFQHMDKHSKLSIEKTGESIDGLQIGFSIQEMATRVSNTLRSIGLVEDFAPLIYIIGHGASSVNNTHYAGYDCGACCGRPGAVNARVFSYMANHKDVREILSKEGLIIPKSTYFIGGMHDTTRDEIEFYDEELIPQEHKDVHQQNNYVFEKALLENARERARRFSTVDIHQSLNAIHNEVKKRSVSLFEPRPELNHATNALCIIGRGSLTKKLFLDRRPFMNSYDYRQDPEGKLLLSILNAAAPVCGGINLEYYFSRVDQQKLGAGTKLPHNVVGLFAVSNGIDGDLRPGLPSQMIEVHDPIRILFIIEHSPNVVLETIQRNPSTFEWFQNEWILLAIKDPYSNKILRYKDGKISEYLPLNSKPQITDEILSFIKESQDNLPVLMELV
ncbi:YbcC family protein [Peijinzhouia sedimentorum]